MQSQPVACPGTGMKAVDFPSRAPHQTIAQQVEGSCTGRHLGSRTPKCISPTAPQQNLFWHTLPRAPGCSDTSLGSVIYFKTLFILPASARMLASQEKPHLAHPGSGMYFDHVNFHPKMYTAPVRDLPSVSPSGHNLHFSCFQKAAIPFHILFCTPLNKTHSQHGYRDKVCGIHHGYLNTSNPITWIYSNTFSCWMLCCTKTVLAVHLTNLHGILWGFLVGLGGFLFVVCFLLFGVFFLHLSTSYTVYCSISLPTSHPRMHPKPQQDWFGSHGTTQYN